MTSKKEAQYKAYWKSNVSLVIVLMILWAIPSFVLGILLVEPLNQIKLMGFPLGFWFAQQGSIYVFVALILAYALIMDRLDAKYIDGDGEETEVAE